MNPWRSLKGLPASLFVLALAAFVNRAGSTVMPFLVLYLTSSLGVTAEMAGGILATYGATALVASPLGGRLCDRFGARQVLVGSLVLSGVVMLLYPLAHTVPVLLVATVLLSLVVTSFRPASMALVGQLAPEDKRKQAFALQRLAVHLGFSIGPALGGLLAAHWFAGIFIVDGVTSLLSAALVVAFLPAALTGAAGKPQLAVKPSEPVQEAETSGGEPKADEAPERRAYGDPEFLRFCMGLLCIALVMFQMDAALPIFVTRELGLGANMFGLLFTINTVIIIVVEVPLNVWLERWSHRRAMVSGALLTTLGFAATGLATGFGGIAACVAVWTVGEMILFPSSSAYASQRAPATRAGEYMGLYTMAFSVAFMIAPWGGVAILDRLGSDVLWLCTLVIGLLGTLLFATVPPPEPEPRR
ncbi:MFS transporter [Sorangium sp. So ce321]|uniref:MDR family MFS transporter n=1 Tax=Sorangium sp. So ce321 TaxID=3133300 RepID=UPI003F600F33